MKAKLAGSGASIYSPADADPTIRGCRRTYETSAGDHEITAESESHFSWLLTDW
jgi:hypothetical protein